MTRGLLSCPERAARLLGMLDAGVPIPEIAKAFGVSGATIRRARQKLGRAPFEHIDPERIVAMRDEGRTYEEICAAMGVSVQTVWRALKRAGRVREYAPRQSATPRRGDGSRSLRSATTDG